MQTLLAEAIGTMLLVLLGDGVVANVVLNRTKGQNGGWIVITVGWGVAVAMAVYAVGGQTAVEAEGVVQRQTQAQLQGGNRPAGKKRDQKFQRLDEMGRDPQQGVAFAEIEPDQPEIQYLEVPQAAVHDPRGLGGRSAPEVGALEERHTQPAHRGIPRDAAADDATSDHRHVECLCRYAYKSRHALMILGHGGGPRINGHGPTRINTDQSGWRDRERP